MKLLDVTYLNAVKNPEPIDLNKSIVKQTSNIDISNAAALDKVSINIDKEEAPSTLTYSGHGMLEVYPANLSISYVVGHEQRHANHNRLRAAVTKEDLHQHIKYDISFKEGKLIANGGVTEAVFTPQDKEVEHSIDRLDAENFNKIISLQNDKEKLEASLKEAEGKEGKSEDNLVSLERLKIKQKISVIGENISELKKVDMHVDLKRQSEAANVIKDISNDHTTIRELADIFTSSFKFVEREVPKVVLMDSVSSGIRVDDAINSVAKIKEENPNPVDIDVRFNRSNVENKINTWSDLRKRLGRLSLSVQNLVSEESFNTHKVSSTNKDALTAESNINTKDASHSVEIANIFTPQKIVSNIQSDPFASLNLQGNIQINGFEVSVVTADSLNDIKDKINLGEDINGNSQLDLTEDLNGNGSLDSFIIGEGTKVFAIFEDVDSDRRIDPSEDTNNNERIDGGSMALKVSASLENNQLILKAIDSGDIHLSEDSNQVLSALGFLTTDINNNTVLKHDTADSQSYMVLNQSRQDALLNVNGNTYQKDTNKISDLISDLTLNLKDRSDSKIDISVTKDLNKGLNVINEFIDSFNSALVFINDQLEFKDSMKGEPSMQRIRTNLVASVEDINTQPDTGIKIKNRDKNSYHELSIVNMLKGLKDGLSSMLKIPVKGENSIFSNMEDLGIITKEDDTLSVDMEKLKDALRDKPQQLFSTFEGIAVNMYKTINKSLDNNIGEIETKQIVLLSQIDSFSALNSIREDIYKVKVSFEEAKSKNIIIA